MIQNSGPGGFWACMRGLRWGFSQHTLRLGEPLVVREVSECRGLLALLFVQPREVVVRVREPPVGRERDAIGVDGVGRPAQVFERDSQIEGGGGVRWGGRERL